MTVQYRMSKQVLFLPQIIVPKPDFWGFDRISGKRITVCKQLPNSLYYSVAVYQLSSKNFTVLYKTRLYSKHIIGITPDLYKNFILFLRKLPQSLCESGLFDIAKGTFQGKVVIPRKDVHICGLPRYLVVGFHGKIGVECGLVGMKVNFIIYDIVESNLTGYLNLILSNGISIQLRTHPLFSGDGDIYFGDIATLTVFRRQTRYHEPIKHRLRHAIHERYYCTYRFVILSDTLKIICTPGLFAIAFLNVCVPVDGILEKGSGNITFLEQITSFHPYSKDADSNHLHFSTDGSLLHLIRSPKKRANVKEHLSSVDIYTRMRP
jgi:hypothetical protein